uniref:SET and MYND domain containing 1 n=1 Tax=Mus musculus TaxID=10090 RepID=Q8BMV4_MOUSE|nr:unnamed protein product [Mus musculus]
MTIGSMENVEVFTSEGKGRGLKATKEFWAADVIFAERAYSAVVFDRPATPWSPGCLGAHRDPPTLPTPT